MDGLALETAFSSRRQHDHSSRVSDCGDTNACNSVVGGDCRLEESSRSNERRILEEGKTPLKEHCEASSRMPSLTYTMAVGRMAYVGVIVERDADGVVLHGDDYFKAIRSSIV